MSNTTNPVIFKINCKLNETCCDWACCGDDEDCVPLDSSRVRVDDSTAYFYAIMSKFGIPNNQADFYYDFLGWDIDAVEANNWKLPDGTDFQNRRRTCLKRHQKRMDAVRIIRTTVAPIIILLFIVFATVFSCATCELGM